MTSQAPPGMPAEGSTRQGPSQLRLYVTPGTPNSTRAEHNLRTALGEMQRRDLILRLEVVDVSAHVKLALSEGVIVTPTLVGRSRKARLVILGDLSDATKLRLFLETLCET